LRFPRVREGRSIDDDLTSKRLAEAKRDRERRAVRRSDENDAVVRLEAVHLDKQLIERLLALVVTAAESGAAMAADSVDSRR
jgi:hypothetical protein